MFGYDILIIAAAGLIALSVGGVIWTLLYPYLSGSIRADKRIGQIKSEKRPGVGERRVALDAQQRRKNIQSSLKEMDEFKRKKKKGGSPHLLLRLQQAGLEWSKNKYFTICAVTGVLVFIGGLVMGGTPIVALGMAFAGAVGLPFWIVNFLRKRRQRAFLIELPNAVDVIVRGIKSGLPVGECLRIIARESGEPVRTEFQRIVESQQMGMPLAESVGRLHDRMPMAEANFFAIVIAIQQSAGGSLSEALGNLSKVLRDRKKMQGKIKAMSSEAKTSAGIIGALPFIVMFMVYLTTPSYIILLFTTTGGNLILGVSGIWMFIGVMIMRKMINFDF